MPAGDGYAINHGGPVVDVRPVGLHFKRQHVHGVVVTGVISGKDEACGVSGVVSIFIAGNHRPVLHTVGLAVNDFALVC